MAPAGESEAVVGLQAVSAERAVSVESEWPDEMAEAAFLAEARDTGKALVTPRIREEDEAENEPQPLPDLDGLVQRISPEVRGALDELFRARFVRVVRVPGKALKVQGAAK